MRLSLLLPAISYLCFLKVLTTAEAQKTVRVGTYFTTNSSIATYVSQNQAHQGFKFWVYYVNTIKKGLEVGPDTYLIDHINIDTDNLNNNSTLIAQAVQQTVESGLVDFIVGGDTSLTVAVSNALNSSSYTLQNAIVQIQCCTGPRNVYTNNYINVFGVHLPADTYSYPFLKYIRTLGYQNLYILSSDGAAFTITTGAAAASFAQSLGFNVQFRNYTYGTSVKASLTDLVELVKQASNSGAEILLTVGLNEDGVLMTRALQSVQYDFKQVFITVAPTEPGYLNNDTYLAGQYVMSPTQWHHTMSFEDETGNFYGSQKYVNSFRNWMVDVYGLKNADYPTYTHASGTAAGVLLQLGILKAQSVNGTAVKDALRNFNANTFFGKIQMDENQRNIGRDTAVVQIINNVTFAVLPTGFADHLPQQPALWQARLGCIGANLTLSKDQKYCLTSLNQPISTSNSFRSTTIIASLLILLTIVCGVLVYYYRNRKEIKAISPTFSYITLFGLIVCYANAFVFNGIPNEAMCTSRPLIGAVGFGLVYSSILAKTYRISRIFHAASVFTVVGIPKKTLLGFVGGIVGIELIISVIWILIDPPRPTKILLSNDQNFVVECVSLSTNAIFPTILYIFNGLIVIFGSILAWKTRNVAEMHNECRPIAYSISTILLSFVIGLMVLYTPLEPSNIQFIIQNFLIFIPTTVTLCVIFGLRVFQAVDRKGSRNESKPSAIPLRSVMQSALTGLSPSLPPGFNILVPEVKSSEVIQEYVLLEIQRQLFRRWERRTLTCIPNMNLLFLTRDSGEADCINLFNCEAGPLEENIAGEAGGNMYILPIAVVQPRSQKMRLLFKQKEVAEKWHGILIAKKPVFSPGTGTDVAGTFLC